jgi:hypothetical protein
MAMDPSFDRGEVDRASLEATERLRQRLAEERKTRAASARRPTVLPWIIVGSLAVFLAGMLANPWFEARVRDQLPFAVASRAPAPSVAELQALQDRLALLEARPQVSEDAPPPNERLARTEARVETSTDLLAREADRIDRLTADFATLNARLEADRARDETATMAILSAADRTEAILAVILARRAFEEGRPLGAIDAALRRAFDVRHPAAVNALAAFGASPVRLADLRRELETMPSLDGDAGGRGRSWWDIFGTRVSRLIRPATDADLPPARSAAAAAMARGDVRAAAAQLRRLPAPRPAALDRWLVAADRYATAEEALRTLETAALIPRASLVELAPPPPVQD